MDQITLFCVEPINILEHMILIRESLQGIRTSRHPAMHVSPVPPSYDKKQATAISFHKSLKKTTTHAHRLLLERVQSTCHLEGIKTNLPFILQPCSLWKLITIYGQRLQLSLLYSLCYHHERNMGK